MSKDEKSNYYDKGGLETIDIIKAKLTPEQYTGYLLGNTIKYTCRLNFKGSAKRDAEKLANYSKWLADQEFTEEDVVVKRMVKYPPREPEDENFVKSLRTDRTFRMKKNSQDADNFVCGCSECGRDCIADISKRH